MSTKEFTATETAIREARSYGLYGATALRLRRMARRAAPYTGSYGNRRFHDFVLDVSDGVIRRVTRVETQPANQYA